MAESGMNRISVLAKHFPVSSPAGSSLPLRLSDANTLLLQLQANEPAVTLQVGPQPPQPTACFPSAPSL